MSFSNFTVGGEESSSMPFGIAVSVMCLVTLILVVLVATGVIKVKVSSTSRMTQPAVGIMNQTAAHPDATRLDAANQGSGTYDAPVGTPAYSDEAAQVAYAQLAKAKSGFRSRFYNSRANGPSARYVPAYKAAEAKERASMGKQDATLASALGGN
jgi:hypothetical protein